MNIISIGIAFKAVVYTASFNSCNWCQNSNVEHGGRANRSRGDDGASVCCHAFSVCMKNSDIDLFRKVAECFYLGRFIISVTDDVSSVQICNCSFFF